MSSSGQPKVVFFGTPEFAVPALQALAASYVPSLVVTRPDAKVGRGQQLQPSPIKLAAETAGLPLVTPENLAEIRTQLHELRPHLGVVVAYGQLLPPWLLELFPHGVLNIHPSLLPKYRGASPIQAAILGGDTETGVTVILLDDGLDTGPIIEQETELVFVSDTAASLSEKLALTGATTLVGSIPGFLDGSIKPQPQNDQLVTLTKQIKKSDGQLDWSKPAEQLEREVRAYTPWPGAYTHNGHQRLAVQEALVVPVEQRLAPGAWLIMGDSLFVGTGNGILSVETMQPAGKKSMRALDWVRGQRFDTGQFT